MTDAALIAVSLGVPTLAFLVGMWTARTLSNADVWLAGHEAGFHAAIELYRERAGLLKNVAHFPKLKAVK